MTTAELGKAHEILLVEDNLADSHLTAQVLKKIGVIHNLSVVRNGVEAMDFLRQEGMFLDAPRPDIILLDLNMSRKDGRETLAEIKTNTHLKNIPVIVFTTSNHDRDIFDSYHHSANAYIIKPRELSEYVHVMKALTDFWFDRHCKMPPLSEDWSGYF